MSRRAWFISGGLLLSLGVGFGVWWSQRDGAGGGYNVLIISLDTVRGDRVGFNGWRLPDGTSPTPHLDALAESCAGMTEAVTPSPLTLPAHTSLFTGLYPDRHGIRENDSFMLPGPEERPFSLLAEDLKAAGYASAAFVSGQPLEERYGLDKGFRYYEDTGEEHNPQGRLTFRERPAEHTIDRAIGHLEENLLEKAKPWFLFVHLFDAHDPYLWHGPHGGLDETKRVDRYMSEIIHLDTQVKRLLDALGNEAKRTLIIITADHGEGLGDHGEWTHGFTLYQSVLRVPFLLKPPTGVDVSALAADGPPARLVDVHPTVLDVCKVTPVKGADRDGRSLLDASRAEGWHAFAETLYPYYQFGYAHQRCCQSADRKLIDGGARDPELYAWLTDRPEANDLASSEPGRVGGLRARLLEHAARPGRTQAVDVVVQPGASVPYMGGRTIDAPLEPTPEENAKLPVAVDRWKVIKALDSARRNLRPESMNPHQASLVLAPFAAECDTNPALLWWTARARQLQSRSGVSPEGRAKYADEARALYEKHHARFKDPRAFDAALGALRDRYEAVGGHDTLKEIVRRATGELALASGARGRGKRPRTLILRASAYEDLGELDKAIADCREARKLERDPSRKKRLQDRITRLERSLRQSGMGK